MLEINKVDDGRTFFALIEVFYRNAILKIVHKDHVFLQERSGFKVLEFIDGLRQRVHRQGAVDPLQGRKQNILVERRVIIARHVRPVDIGISQFLVEKLQNRILVV